MLRETFTEYRVWLDNGHRMETTDLPALTAWANQLGHDVVSVESREVTNWEELAHV